MFSVKFGIMYILKELVRDICENISKAVGQKYGVCLCVYIFVQFATDKVRGESTKWTQLIMNLRKQ